MPIPSANIHTVNTSLSPADSAADYERVLTDLLGPSRVIDVVLLGMGPDGHTCSLFPHHAGLQATTAVTSVTDSPKPPPNRVTLTLPVVNAARSAAFVCAGAGKAEKLRQVLEDDTVPSGE